MYGKYIPKRKNDIHFDVLFDYAAKAETARKAQQALHNHFGKGLTTNVQVKQHAKTLKQ